MKKTLLLALVLTPLMLSSTGCASKKRMKRLEAELIQCRESRTKLIKQQRSELEPPADEATEDDPTVDQEESTPYETTAHAELAALNEDPCSAPVE